MYPWHSMRMVMQPSEMVVVSYRKAKQDRIVCLLYSHYCLRAQCSLLVGPLRSRVHLFHQRPLWKRPCVQLLAPNVRRPHVNVVAFKLCIIFMTTLCLHTGSPCGSVGAPLSAWLSNANPPPPFYSSKLLLAQCLILITEWVVEIVEHISDYRL